MDAKRIVFVGGFGHWPQVVGEFQGRCDVEYVGIAPAYDGESLDAIRNHSILNNVALYSGCQTMLSELQPDIVVVSTRPDQVARNAILAADAGCDIICEKPIGLTGDELKAVMAAVQKNKVSLLPMLSMRFDPVMIKARELFQAGAIGEVASISAQKSYPFGDRQDWFGDRTKYGGTLPWVGIHAVDMIQFVTGLEFVSVMARHVNFSHAVHPDCEDSCSAIFELTNGAFASVTADLFRPVNAPTYGDDRIRVAGTKGVLEAISNEGAVRLINDGGEQVIPADLGPVPFYGRLLVSTNDGFPLVGPGDGFVLTAAVLAARESADRDGAAVKII